MMWVGRLKLFFLLILQKILHSTCDVSIPSFSCPRNRFSPPIQVPPNTLINIKKTRDRIGLGFLCTLTRVTGDLESFAQVARSYDGFEWENVAGPYSASLEIDCPASARSKFCTLQVPNITSDDQRFELVSYEYGLHPEDELARFFEQSTFGTTRKDLRAVDPFNYNNLAPFFSNWVHEQIYSTPPTLHRVLWRSQAVPREIRAHLEAAVNHPCEVGARWRIAAFDVTDLNEEITATQMVNGTFAISINGQVRTVVRKIGFVRGNLSFDFNLPYQICGVSRTGEHSLRVLHNGKCESIKGGNPPIDLDRIMDVTDDDPPLVFHINENSDSFLTDNDSNIELLVMTKSVTSLDPVKCASVREDGRPVFARLNNGQGLIFDSRLVLHTNTPENPLDDGGGSISIATELKTKCSNVPRSFLNEEACRVSKSHNACTNVRADEAADIELDAPTIRKINQLTGRNVLAIKGLSPNDPSLEFPCDANARSRWMPSSMDLGMCPDDIHENTTDAFRDLIQTSSDPNPFMKDIYFDAETCHENDTTRRKFYVLIDGVCWTNIHPNEFDVYDFSEWALDHPGGSWAIYQFADNATEFLNFPESHEMWRWQDNYDDFPRFGRFGDIVRAVDLPTHIRGSYFDELAGFFRPDLNGQGSIVCGSPEESSNINSSHLTVDMNLDDAKSEVYGHTPIKAFRQSRKDVWTMTTLAANDQLRQRMAWALSQILAISPDSFGDTLSSEMFVQFYDIFVRNAFGNYKDLLREVSYSPMMAQMLTYVESQSQEYIYTTRRRIQYADENYAREIMQLFSIGLIKLNMDGSPELDDGGREVLTYTNEEIEEYARAWTGFTRQVPRGNIELQEGTLNSIDPMFIKVEWRDVFPKMGLNGKYVGDGYILCSDIPSKAFLREGAMYRLLGKTKVSELQKMHFRDPKAQSDIHVTELSYHSSLRNTLCDLKGKKCRYPPTVTIKSSIECSGIECDLDTVQVVEVGDDVFYEYVKPPCVHQTFFGATHSASIKYDSEASTKCANKNAALASAACCLNGTGIAIHDTCQYTGELIPFHEAEARCVEKGMTICDFDSLDKKMCKGCCNYNGPYWFDGGDTCEVEVITNAQGGVALEGQGEAKRIYLKSLTFFRVHWEGGFPSPENDCGEGFCKRVKDYCRCRVKNLSEIAFTDVPQKEDVLDLLSIGGLPPTLADYAAMEKGNGVNVYFSIERGEYDKSVVFEVIDEYNRKRYLKNIIERIELQPQDDRNNTGSFVFRNPPTFYNIFHPEVRDAKYETEAVIDHVFYHQNTAPFLAQRLIERFGISNPSPRFIKAVAEAFRSGTYVKEKNNFGTGQHGDLAATMAAILLDRESRYVILDEDPSHGSIREPLIKFIALMRNMEYVHTSNETQVGLHHAGEALGQMAHELPSVFSFFLPEYSPPGAVTRAELVAPEAILWHKTIGMVNGLLSLVKFGLTSCYEGLGHGPGCSHIQEGEYEKSMGHLTFYPSDKDDIVENIIDELATLLTSGRMSRVNRDIVRDTYLTVHSETNDRVLALSIIQQLMVTSAEFHTNVLTTNTPRIRDTGKLDAKKTCKKYKAVVHILLLGGMDSYNLLVPHSNCTDKVSYDQYFDVRGPVSLSKKSLLELDAWSSSQPCKVFGLHRSMPFLKQLYDEGDASFFAGIGVMNEPVSKDNYYHKTKTNLFAHNAMQAEIGRLDPLRHNKGTGALGRLADILSSKGYSVNSFPVDTEFKALEGKLNRNKVSIDSNKGFIRFNPADADSGDLIGLQAERINGKIDGYTNVFSETWSSALHASRQFEEFYWAQEYVNLTADFSRSRYSRFIRKLKATAQMIGSGACRGSDRDLFFLQAGSWDHHSNVHYHLNEQLTSLNEGLEVFVEEMKAQNVWDDVTVVVSSDFGRTLSGNSASGTDHAWSGHSFILGGALDGGKVHGQYPKDLSDNSPLNIGRGRLIPEIPWETLWDPVIQWVGIEDEDDLNYILPNRHSFSNATVEMKEVYLSSSGSDRKSSCQGEGESVTCRPQTGAICDPSDPYCLTITTSEAYTLNRRKVIFFASFSLTVYSFFF